MNPETGEIHMDVLEEEAKRRKLVSIPKEELEAVINMNRKQRRAWAARQRKATK